MELFFKHLRNKSKVKRLDSSLPFDLETDCKWNHTIEHSSPALGEQVGCLVAESLTPCRTQTRDTSALVTIEGERQGARCVALLYVPVMHGAVGVITCNRLSLFFLSESICECHTVQLAFWAGEFCQIFVL